MSKKAGKSSRGGATISVRRNRDGSVSMTSRGAGASDLRKIAPALVAAVSKKPGNGSRDEETGATAGSIDDLRDLHRSALAGVRP